MWLLVIHILKKKRPNAVEGEVSSEIGHKKQAT